VDKPRARFKVIPEDFVVDEIPAYLPEGQGDHLYLHIKKRGLTTNDAVARIADTCGVPRRDVGVAGLKDKVAVTTQWLSIPALPGTKVEEKARAIEPDGTLEVLSLARHKNKLRTGHLDGNRFTIRLRGLSEAELPAISRTFLALGESGVPNAFGAQRFGKYGDNVERALAFLSGKERGPRDFRAKKFLFSSLQSHVFNAVLAEREALGTWNRPLLGDLLKLETGGMFVCTDVATDTDRAARGELGPTGPMFGVKMRSPEADALAFEAAIVARELGPSFDLAATQKLGEGTRRPLVLRPKDVACRVEATPGEQGPDLLVEFVLPKGAYATTVLARVVDAHEGSSEPAHDSADGSQDGDPIDP
jgi:tRNA pseudouridine13 synthase